MNAYRTVLEADLAPVAGSLFQPTEFPDLGAAEFGDHALLVESAQSMANWLEGTTWDEGRSDQVAELGTLPYARVVSAEGDFLSSSRLEAHRLASAYIMNGTVNGTTGEKWLEEQLGLAKGRPLDYRAVARTCFRLDPVSLVHGVFFARKAWPWHRPFVRYLIAWVPRGLRAEEVAALLSLRELSGRRGDGYEVRGLPPAELLFQAAGPVGQVAPELCGPARRWRSLTPYLPVRHRKRESLEDFLTADVRTELGYRDLPPATVIPADPGSRLPDRWALEFRRYRMAESMSRSRPGLGLQLEFAEPVGGPLLVGQLSHFGYGIFIPDEDR